MRLIEPTGVTARSEPLRGQNALAPTDAAPNLATPVIIPPPAFSGGPQGVEAVRYLVSALQQRSGASRLPPRIGFTSAIRGEGVSYVARLVAEVVAHDLAQRVCLVHLNWGSSTSNQRRDRRHGRHRQDPAPLPAGLSDVLSGDVGLAEVISPTATEGLTVVHAGTATAAVAHVLSRSDGLGGLLQILEDRNDLLVLDLPAVLSSSAALPMAHHADALALVVRHGVTTELQAKQAVERLGQKPSAGIVLNAASTKLPRAVRRRMQSW